MIGRLINDIMKPDTASIQISCGWCTPIREKIGTVLKPYGVQYTVEGSMLHRNGIGPYGEPTHFTATVRTSRKSVEWTEYLLLRSNKFELVSRPHNAKNRAWAVKHQGQMPTPWAQMNGTGKPWRDADCHHKYDPKTGKITEEKPKGKSGKHKSAPQQQVDRGLHRQRRRKR